MTKVTTAVWALVTVLALAAAAADVFTEIGDAPQLPAGFQVTFPQTGGGGSLDTILGTIGLTNSPLLGNDLDAFLIGISNPALFSATLTDFAPARGEPDRSRYATQRFEKRPEAPARAVPRGRFGLVNKGRCTPPTDRFSARSNSCWCRGRGGRAAGGGSTPPASAGTGTCT